MCVRTTGQMIPTPTLLQRSTVLPTSSKGRKRRLVRVYARIAARPPAHIRPWKVQLTISQIWPSTAIICKSRVGQRMFPCTMRDMPRSKTSLLETSRSNFTSMSSMKNWEMNTFLMSPPLNRTNKMNITIESWKEKLLKLMSNTFRTD